ncbi:hypothetical protein J8J32_21610, partial [Mycobacterium tuberculosis]|nr:hypothetical protein [Mycobacterium tuberculosis]
MFQLFRRRSTRVAAMAALASGVAVAGYALHALAADEPGADKIKASIQKMLGGRAEVKSVTKAPVPGLYEVNA